MIFAPLSFLRGPQPQRNSTHKSQNPCHFVDVQDRPFEIEYLTPTPDHPYSHRQIFHPNIDNQNDKPMSTTAGITTIATSSTDDDTGSAGANTKPNQEFEPSIFTPPPHYHMLQDEHFKIESGRGVWYLDNGNRQIALSEGDEIVVPRRRWHWFEIDPRSTQPLSVLYRYDAEYVDMENQFFRNTIGCVSDCWRDGKTVSVWQLQVFALRNWMCFGLVAIGGPEWTGFVVNALLTFGMGFVGEFLLGYRSTYPEYYQQH